MLVESGRKYNIPEFIEWAKQYLEGYLKYAYIRVDGTNKIIRCLLTEPSHTVMYSRKSVIMDHPIPLDYVEMPTTYILPILRTILNLEKDEDKVVLWNYLRDIMYSFNIGDIGELGGKKPSLNLDTSIDDPFALMALVELYNATKNIDYLNVARTIGNNIVKERFHRGFFVENEILLYSRLDQPDTLALLILDGVIKGYKLDEMPFYLADSGYIHGYLLADDGVVEDRNYSHRIIYTKTIYDWE